MGGFFGTVSKAECVTDLFYGTDYNSHLGTKRAGMATYAEGEGFIRSIHNLESSYFRTKFESELPKFKGKAGIGVISDTDPQPGAGIVEQQYALLGDEHGKNQPYGAGSIAYCTGKGFCGWY